MGSDESHFNVSVGSGGQSHCRGQCPQTTTFSTRWNCRRAEAVSNRGPSAAYQPNALPLGQTGSLNLGRLPQSLINRMKVMWLPHITKIHIDPIFGRKAEANHNQNEDTRFSIINQYRYGISVLSTHTPHQLHILTPSTSSLILRICFSTITKTDTRI